MPVRNRVSGLRMTSPPAVEVPQTTLRRVRAVVAELAGDGVADTVVSGSTARHRDYALSTGRAGGLGLVRGSPAHPVVALAPTWSGRGPPSGSATTTRAEEVIRRSLEGMSPRCYDQRVESTGVHAQFHEPAVRAGRLERLLVGERDPSSVAACLRCLRDAGLHAEASRVDPGGIVGGLEKSEDEGIVVFGDSFQIRPVVGGFAVAVPGVGRFDEEIESSLPTASQRVVALYRARDRLRRPR